jgi:serine/threonine-protein kinase
VTVFEGAQIGGYRVLRQIGEGGMGAVWMAEHAMLGRRAAIKILHPSFSARQDIVTRFFNEARAATAISDPGIIQIFDFGFHTDGSAYIVMELLDGEPLDRRLQRFGTLSIRDALRICRQVASTVGAAHARGIVHRDLKPENIFVVRDPEVAGGERAKVLDFGIAKLAGDLGAKQMTNASAVMGTPLYMSPEQCRGAGRVDQRSDVYSLGCVLFALVTGHAPFTAEGTGEIIMQHMIAPPPRPSTRAVGIPAEIDELILRCLAKDPAERFASGTELAAAIDTLTGRPSIMSLAPLSPRAASYSPASTTLGSAAAAVASPATAARGRRGKLYVGSATLLVAGGVIVAVIASRGSPESPETPAAPTVNDPASETAKPQPPPPPAAAEDPGPAQVKADMQALLTAFSKWATGHAGAPCPTSTELGDRSDPWGHPYQITCTDQPVDQTVGVVSMGPDGVVGTDDDLTSWALGRDVTGLARGKRWISTPIAAKPSPSAPAQPTPRKPPPKKPKPEAPTTKQPPSPTAPQPPKPSGIVDLDGDGIPDTR